MYYTDQELAQMANMQYPGGDPRLNYSQPEEPAIYYDGSGDLTLDFGDSDVQSFALKGHKNRQFTMIIANANALVRVARLYGGYNQFSPALVPGLVTDGAFTDVNGDAGLTGTSGNAGKTIQEFLNFILFNPTRIAALKILSTDTSQINNVMSVNTLTPFKATTDSGEIYAANEQNEYTFQNNTSVLATNFQLSNQENVIYNIVGSSTLTLTWFCGASYNTALALARKAKLAKRTISNMDGGHMAQLGM